MEKPVLRLFGKAQKETAAHGIYPIRKSIAVMSRIPAAAPTARSPLMNLKCGWRLASPTEKRKAEADRPFHPFFKSSI